MEMNDFIQIVCPKCKALLFAEERLDFWYCGHCGEKIEIIKEEEKKSEEKAASVLTGDIFLCNKDILVKYAGHDEDVDIPENITKIDSGAFKGNTEIKTVHIPDSVMEISASAFENCTELVSVCLSNQLKTIDYKTFSGCSNLKSITVPASVEAILHGAMCCGLDEIVFENSETTWELETEYADPSFDVCRKAGGEGVKKIYLKGSAYEASEVYRSKSMATYLKNKGLCPKCGGKYGMFGKCKGCGSKKEQ
ncbi:MAG: leucine-rich repeat domain-containing protein [Ruminococcus sp.]|nr:leucine-rich repeat domain-containing protein [Ruminococcus sp.]